MEAASDSIFDRHGDSVVGYDEQVSRMHKEAEQIARENFENDARRERESIESIKGRP